MNFLGILKCLRHVRGSVSLVLFIRLYKRSALQCYRTFIFSFPHSWCKYAAAKFKTRRQEQINIETSGVRRRIYQRFGAPYCPIYNKSPTNAQFLFLHSYCIVQTMKLFRSEKDHDQGVFISSYYKGTECTTQDF